MNHKVFTDLLSYAILAVLCLMSDVTTAIPVVKVLLTSQEYSRCFDICVTRDVTCLLTCLSTEQTQYHKGLPVRLRRDLDGKCVNVTCKADSYCDPNLGTHGTCRHCDSVCENHEIQGTTQECQELCPGYYRSLIDQDSPQDETLTDQDSPQDETLTDHDDLHNKEVQENVQDEVGHAPEKTEKTGVTKDRDPQKTVSDDDDNASDGTLSIIKPLTITIAIIVVFIFIVIVVAAGYRWRKKIFTCRRGQREEWKAPLPCSQEGGNDLINSRTPLTSGPITQEVAYPQPETAADEHRGDLAREQGIPDLQCPYTILDAGTDPKTLC